MKKALIAAAVAAGSAVAIWAYRHPPFHLPGPILDNPILWEAPAPPRHLTKVISVSACALVNGYTWNGPGVSAAFGAVLPVPGDYLINPNTPLQGPVTDYTQPDTVLLFCDARLPAEAVAYDYAELEYFAPDEPGNVAPTLAGYLDARAPSVNGYAYDQTMPLASCQGALTPLYSGINAISVCSTGSGQSFYPDAGLPAIWPGAGWTLYSIHFLITVPPTPDATLPNLVYRVLVHYEAP